MNTSFPHAPRVLAAGLAAGGIFGLSACANPGTSAVTHSFPSGVNARTVEHGGSLCVTGTVRRPFGHPLPPGAHVDIEVLDGSGRVIASGRDGIAPVHPRLEQRRSGRYPFTVCLPRPEQEGWTVRVSYHADAHS